MFWNRSFGLLCVVVSLFFLAACGGKEDVPDGGGGGPGVERCATEADCSAGRPFCVDGACATCRGNADCPAAAPACTAGSCTPCVDDNGCAGRDAQVCDGASGTCVACRIDQDCAGGRCDPATNACVECLTAADCGGAACVANICQQTAGCTSNEQCAADELCILPDGTADFGSCEPICDPYRHGPCDGDDVCTLVTFSPDLRPVGVCLAPNGGAGEQEACDPEACERGLLCVGFGDENERCTSVCDPAAADSCADGFVCTEIDVTAPAGARVGICIPDQNGCETDADCDADEVCTIAVGEDGGLEQVCDRAVGPGRAGAHCTANAECASNFCLPGQQVCYGTCETADHCAAGSTCVDVTFTLPSGATDTAPACFPTCTDDAACNPTQTCSLAMTRARDAFVTVCNPATGTRGAGQACTAATQCKSGICSDGMCFGICDESTDCGAGTECVGNAYLLDTGPDGRVSTADDVWQSIGVCHGVLCATDGDCGAGWACRIMRDPSDEGRGDTMVQRCVGAVGSRRGGAVCGDDDECLSGLCQDPRGRPEDCNDGVDNDGDGRVDCEDVDCHSACFEEHDCGNGIDDDGDGAIDCADGDCAFSCSYESRCGDGIDNDGNGLVDCDDPDCSFACGETSCNDGRDDDGDGLVDCRDDDCWWWSPCRENASPAQCNDGVDNDGDGFPDCADPDCRFESPCSSIAHEGIGASAGLCGDGLDNDGDGFTDCADPGCADVAPCTERSCAGGNCCGDGLDNDGDGKADCADPECASEPACNEIGRCADGLDNDGDRLTDCFDSDCANAPNCNENRCAGGNCCADGLDNDGDGGIDCVDSDCFGTPACNEQACAAGNCCRDGIDGDGDGLLDCDDPDCRNSGACAEFSCGDGRDNDTDGLTDCADPDCFDDPSCGGICFEACEADADCAPGMACAANSAWVTLDFTFQDYGYAPGCVPAPAP